MADAATTAPESIAIMPDYVQQLPAEKREALDKLCSLDDEYLAAADAMRKEIQAIVAKFESEVAPPLLAGRKEMLEAAKLPEFWLKVMQNSHVQELIEDCDEPCLGSLEDITTEMFAEPAQGWKLHFHFADNEFFTNKVLTKTYHTKRESRWDADLDTCKIEATKVAWKEGMDLTVDAVTKGKGKKKKTRFVPRHSFFRFFYPLGEGAEFPPVVPDESDSDEDEDEEEEEETEEERMEGLINDDTVLAECFKDLVIPHAVRHYTAEAVEMDSDEEDSDEEGEDEDEDSDEPGEFDTPQKTQAPSCMAAKLAQQMQAKKMSGA